MTRTSIDFDDREFLYLQLAEIIRTLITEGKILPGRRLPSKADLKREHAVSARTIDSAMDILKTERLIETRAGKGFYVVPPEERIRSPFRRRATDR